MNVIESIYQHYTKRHLISTDSRSIEKDCVFVAIKGERFDGNDFAYKVASDGIAACVIADSVVRIIPGAIGDEASALTDCFQDNLLAPPVYTRPAEFNGWKVPDVLLSGNFAEIEKWQDEEAWRRTKALRPDLIEK